MYIIGIRVVMFVYRIAQFQFACATLNIVGNPLPLCHATCGRFWRFRFTHLKPHIGKGGIATSRVKRVGNTSINRQTARNNRITAIFTLGHGSITAQRQLCPCDDNRLINSTLTPRGKQICRHFAINLNIASKRTTRRAIRPRRSRNTVRNR